jgi:hypothetical protein
MRNRYPQRERQARGDLSLASRFLSERPSFRFVGLDRVDNLLERGLLVFPCIRRGHPALQQRAMHGVRFGGQQGPGGRNW